MTLISVMQGICNPKAARGKRGIRRRTGPSDDFTALRCSERTGSRRREKGSVSSESLEAEMAKPAIDRQRPVIKGAASRAMRGAPGRVQGKAAEKPGPDTGE